MDFNITILGSGAAVPTLGRHCSSQVVNINGFRMLIDCGESTQNQMRVFHQKMQSFGHIFISHLHGDHLFGLPGLLASMSLCGREESVTVFAPKGLKEALEVLFRVSGTNLCYKLNIIELSSTRPEVVFENEKCSVKAFPLPHSVPCYGYLFEETTPLLNLKKDVREKYQLTPIDIKRVKEGQDLVLDDGTLIANSALTLPRRLRRSYAYCCDTAYTEEIIPTIAGVDLLCMESTFDSSRTELALEKQHCTATQAALMAQKADVGQLLLTHFSARFKEADQLVDEAKKVFENTIPAQDGATLSIEQRYESRQG